MKKSQMFNLVICPEVANPGYKMVHSVMLQQRHIIVTWYSTPSLCKIFYMLPIEFIINRMQYSPQGLFRHILKGTTNFVKVFIEVLKHRTVINIICKYKMWAKQLAFSNPQLTSGVDHLA